jgi:cob(I)alamin adenosyltransferase
MPIYTKTGDDGTTALFGGKRVLKCEELVDVYGSIDELNSWIGFIIASVEDSDINGFLTSIQNDLFAVGSTMAGWKGDLTSLNARISEMEKRIDAMEKNLPELTNFILPGGTNAAATTHIARSICRRVERQAVKLIHDSGFQIHDQEIILKYLNRLSDLLFMTARFINSQSNVPEVIWNGKTKI